MLNERLKVLAAEKNINVEGGDKKIRKGLVFTIVALALFMTTVDSTIVATALHTLQQDLHTSLNWVGWILTAYSFGLVLMLPISAKLSMRFGHRRIFWMSVATFTIASICCGLSSNISVIIVLRVIQAMGGAGITPSATGIVVNHFDKSRDRAVSLFGSIFPAGAMIGPIFGGLFVTYWSWRRIFFINAPIGIAIVILSFYYIPKDDKTKGHRHAKMDFPGIVWAGIGLLSIMLATSYMGEKGSKLISTIFIGLLLITIIALIIFFRHIRRTDGPFIAPRFIYGKGFGTVNLLNTLYSGATIGAISLVPLYATTRYDINALNSGTLLVAEGIASVVVSAIITILLRRTGYRMPYYIGSSFIIVGLALLALTPLFRLNPYLWLAGSSFFIGVGMGFNSPPARNAGLQLAPQESATIAALRTLCIQLGAIITIAIATTIITDAQLPARAETYIFIGISALLFLSLPIISKIPEHKGSW